MITFKNTKLVDKQALKYSRSLAEYILDKFFTKPKQAKMKIRVQFVEGLFDKENTYANCVWEDEHRRGNEFTIQVEPKQKINLLLNSIAHELVHVKQWAKGEYYELVHKPKVYKFNGKEVDTSKVDYWDTPWEIEAHGRAIGLVVLWARKHNLTQENLIVEG
jgi:hypothetical protein